MYKNKVLDFAKQVKHIYYLRTKNKPKNRSNQFKDWIKFINDPIANDIESKIEINQFDNFVLFRYGHEFFEGEIFWNKYNGFFRECRSTVIDIDKMQIVLLPFDKFFNLGELEENSIDNINKKINTAKNIEITNKLDGSMQSLRYYNNKLILGGSHSICPDSSWRVAEGIKMIDSNIEQMAKENPDLTFIFELIHILDSKVVKYKKEDNGLYLIGIRNVCTGEQFSYHKVKNISEKYNVKMTNIEDTQFEEILKKSKYMNSQIKEGWVINIDGHLFKLKTDDYVKLHRILSEASSNKIVIEYIANGIIDDLISKLPKIHKNLLLDKVKEIHGFVEKINFQINYFYNIVPKTRNEFYKFTSNEIPKHLIRFLHCKYQNKEYNILLNKFGNPIKYSELKKWSEIECQNYM